MASSGVPFTSLLTSRYGLMRLCQIFTLLYLVLATVAIAIAIPAEATLAHPRVHDAIASVILLGCLCLHMVSAVGRDQFTRIDGMLYAALLTVLYLTLQSPVLGNTNFYIMLTVAACLLASRSFAVLVGFTICMLIANLLGTFGLSLMSAAVLGEHGEHLRLQAWQFFLINLVGFPFFSALIAAYTNMLDASACMVRSATAVPAPQVHPTQAQQHSLWRRSLLHELNNGLSALHNALEIMHAQLEAARGGTADATATLHGVRRWVQLARQAMRQSTEFVQLLRAENVPSTPVRTDLFSVHACVHDLTALLRSTCERQGCQIQVALSRSDLQLQGESGKLAQVLTNLINNAIASYRDAPPARERTIRVAVEDEGEAVMIAVADEGCGIPAEHLPHIFDYLFTTRSSADGSGMGLAIVRDIVSDHFGGTITVCSEVGKGTTFKLMLPSPSPSHLVPNND
jgi:signal transduction histidine kinase